MWRVTHLFIYYLMDRITKCHWSIGRRGSLSGWTSREIMWIICHSLHETLASSLHHPWPLSKHQVMNFVLEEWSSSLQYTSTLQNQCQGALKLFLWPNTLLRHSTLFIPLFCHLAVVHTLNTSPTLRQELWFSPGTQSTACLLACGYHSSFLSLSI